MKTKFLLGVCISVALLIVNQLIIQRALSMQKKDASLINLAGRQRMLAEKIELEFQKLFNRNATIEPLERNFKEWKSAHERLLTESGVITESLASSDPKGLYLHWQTDLYKKINFIEQQIASYKNRSLSDLDEIVRNQDTFVSQMDFVVQQLVRYSDKKLTRIITLELIFAGLSVLVIFLVVRYIYYPQANLLKKSLTDIQSKNKELEQYNYIASHDLKEPLRTISNYIQVIKEDYSGQIPDEVLKHLQTIDKAAGRMNELIRSLLDYSRLGKDRKPASVVCPELVSSVVEDLDNLIRVNKAEIIIHKLPVVIGYATELRQLFQNLIVNAIKFRKKEIAPVITIGYVNNKNTHEFYVADNGIGIEAKHFERIFHMFQRLSAHTEADGYGIGLANCRKIAEIHNGKLWVESEPGKGSTFKFTIHKNLL